MPAAMVVSVDWSGMPGDTNQTPQKARMMTMQRLKLVGQLQSSVRIKLYPDMYMPWPLTKSWWLHASIMDAMC